MFKPPVLLLGALQQETAAYEAQLRTRFGRKYWRSNRVVCDTTGVGKVNAAAVTAELIAKYEPKAIIFTGVAGALESSLGIGDIGIVNASIDADVNLSAFRARYKVGQLPDQNFEPEKRTYLSEPWLVNCALSAFIPGAKTFLAYAATSDTFQDKNGKARLNSMDLVEELPLFTNSARPNICDMESSAVMQVAALYRVPSLVIRAVSDTLDGNAAKEFNNFIKDSIASYIPILDDIMQEL